MQDGEKITELKSSAEAELLSQPRGLREAPEELVREAVGAARAALQQQMRMEVEAERGSAGEMGGKSGWVDCATCWSMAASAKLPNGRNWKRKSGKAQAACNRARVDLNDAELEDGPRSNADRNARKNGGS